MYPRDGARLRGLPSRRVQPHDRAQSRGGRLPDDVRELPSRHRQQLPRRGLQPHRGVPAGGPARAAGLRGVPQEQRVSRDGARLRGLPSVRSTSARRSPSHAAAGFSTTCETCHRATDSSWTQGRFNHRFPITSGRHQAPCSTCHQSGTSYQNFTCLTCHEHSQSRMDDQHRGRNGYRYESRACYSCHPTGRRLREVNMTLRTHVVACHRRCARWRAFLRGRSRPPSPTAGCRST